MSVTVLLFASAREAAGVESTQVELQGGMISSQDLLRDLVSQFPGLESVLKSCVIALNQEYLEQGSSTQIKRGDEVAIIPPLSGG